MYFFSKRSALIALCISTVLLFSIAGASPNTSWIPLLRAQDVTPEQTPSPEPPTEIPPVEATPEVTGTPTAEPTLVEAPTAEATPEVTPEVTAAPTSEATLEVSATPVYPPVASPFSDDFQDGETSGWLLGDGWGLASEETNTYLTSVVPNSAAAIADLHWQDVLLLARVRVEQNSLANISIRSRVESYTITLDFDGFMQLSRSGVLLAQGAAPVIDPTIENPPSIWRTVIVRAVGADLIVIVDAVTQISYTDAQPLGAGGVTFSVSAVDSTLPASAAFDEVRVEDLSIVPTPAPTEEATAEVTAEATPEATPEATSEATPEATPDVGAPTGLSAEVAAKLGGGLGDVLTAYLSGDLNLAAQTAQNFGITFLSDGRLEVIVWVSFSSDVGTLAAVVQQLGGEIVTTEPYSVTARLTLDQLVPLVNTLEVGAITLPVEASSTGPVESFNEQGATNSEGFDTIGANPWRTAGIRGAGVDIAVIDTSFAGITAGNGTGTGDNRCLFNTPGGTTGNHGANVVEVLCDIVPDARVYGYIETTAAGVATRISTLTSDVAIGYDIILITLDLGVSISPGDGTDGGVAGTSVYDAIAAARAVGKLVVVSAGNNNGRYVAGTLTNTNVLTITAANTLPVPSASAPALVNMSWDGWNNSTDLTVELNVTGVGVQNKPARTPGQNPGTQFSFATCTDTTPADGFCDSVVLTITNNSGASRYVQVQTNSGAITAPSAGGWTLDGGVGSLARPADAADALTVGAVCSVMEGTTDWDNTLADSSRGPIFGAGGTTAVAITQRGTYKPDVAGPSIVSTSFAAAPGDCTSPGGFRGTSAAAAHVAGMSALLISNNSVINSGGQPFARSLAGYGGASAADRIENYLQAHTVDMPLSNPDGFDTRFGAGLTMLGNPNPTYDLVSSITTPPDTLGCSFALYVNPSAVGSLTTLSGFGSITNPYPHIGNALRDTIVNGCVVTLPGEYVTPIYIDSFSTTPYLLSYDYLSSASYPPSVLWSNLGYTMPTMSRQGAVAATGALVSIRGMTFQWAGSAANTGLFSPTAPFVFDSMVDFSEILSSTFTGFRAPGTIVRSNVNILGSTFTNFVASPGAPAILSFEGDLNYPIGNVSNGRNQILLDANTFSNNTGSDSISNELFEPLIRVWKTDFSAYNNTFSNNTAETLFSVENTPNAAGSFTTDASFVTTFYGNVFSNNNLTDQIANSSQPGPMINLNPGRRFRFVNNTVVDNTLGTNTATSSGRQLGVIIGFGNALGSANGFDGTAQGFTMGLIDIQNNLFYNNLRSDASTALINEELTGTNLQVECDSNAGGDDNGSRNNWVYPAPSTTLLCNFIGNGNITDAPRALNTTPFFGTALDLTHPFRLRPVWVNNDGTTYSPTTNVPGINAGDNAAVNNILGSLLSGQDRAGNPRLVNTTIDIGAYELAASVNIAAPNLAGRTGSGDTLLSSLRVNEDTSVVTFQLNTQVTGSYAPYSYTLVSSPAIYDTNPNNACGGQPILFDAVNGVALYCPPPNFYNLNDGGAQDLIRNDTLVRFSYTINGTPLDTGIINSTSRTVEFNFLPMGDAIAPTTTIQNVVADFSSGTVEYLLTPNVVFTPNFATSSATFGVDYQFNGSVGPYTWAYVAASGQFIGTLQPGGSTELFDPDGAGPLLPNTENAIIAALAEASDNDGVNDGVLVLYPVPGVSGTYEFRYNVNDKDGSIASGVSAPNNTIRVTVVPHAAGVGIHDDTTVDAVYSAGWTPQYNASSFNNTLHYTNGNNESVQFFFVGDGFSVTLLGNTLGGEFAVSLDADGLTGAEPLRLLDAAGRTPFGAGFTCSTEISTVNGRVNNVRNPNTFYTIGCRGIDGNFPGSVRMLELKNIGTGQLYIDAFEVLGVGGAANPGYFENTDGLRLNYSAGWLTATGGRGGTTAWSITPSHYFAFDINLSSAAAGEGIVLYHYNGLTSTYKLCVTDTSVAPTACSAGTMFTTVGINGRRFISETELSLAGVTGARRIVISPSGDNWFGFDAVFIMGSANGLDTLTLAGVPNGQYEDYDANIRRIGTWTSYAVPAAIGGNLSVSTDAYAAMLFNADAATQGIAVFTTNAAGYATFEVCIYSATAVSSQDDVCQTFNTAATTTAYGRVNVLRLPIGTASSARVVEIRQTSGGALVIEAVRLLGAVTPLPDGNYDDGQTLDLNFSSGWLPASGGRAGITTWSNLNSTFVWFEMNFSTAEQGEGIVIYANNALPTAGVNVCVTAAGGASPTTGCTSPTFTYVLGSSRRQWITEADLGVSAVTGARRIIISPSGTNWLGFDGVLLVGQGNTIGAPLTLAGGSPASFYEPENANVLKVGTWTEIAAAGALGGDTHYALGPNNALLFNVESAVQGVAVYTTNGSGYATGEVCIYSATSTTANDDSCTTFNTNTTAGTGIFIVRIPSGTSTTPANATRLVEIRITSAAYLLVQGFRLLGAQAPLPPGSYDDAQVAELNYSATGWLSVPNSGRGNYSTWTNSAAATTFMWFDMNFDQAAEGEGILLYNVAGFAGAGVNVCVTTTGAAPTSGCTSPTTSTTFGTATRQWFTETQLGANNVTGARRIIISPSSAAGSGQWFGFDGIVIVGQNNTIGAPLTLAGGSPAGFYEPENANVLKVGTWTEATDAGALGGDTHYALGIGQAMLFNVDSATQGVAVYTTNGAGYATGEVCVYSATNNASNDDACATFNTNMAAGQGIFFVRVPAGTTTTPVGATRLVEIRITSAAYLFVQGFRLLSAAAPLPFGYYEDSQTSDLNYSGTGWLPVASGRGNVSMWTNSGASTTFMWFEMNFTTANEGEGIIIYNAAGFPSAGVNICVMAAGGAAPTNGCSSSPTFTYTFGTKTQRWISETDLGMIASNTTQRVIISPSSAAGSGQWFGFDGITLVGQDSTIGAPLTLAGGSPTSFYEPENANVRRVGAWTEIAATGALGNDVHYTNTSGQAMLFNVDSATQGIAIYTTNGSGYATGELCVYSATNNASNDDACVTFNTNGAAGTGIQFVRIPSGTATTPAGANRLVEVRVTSAAFMFIQGFRLVGAQTALAPGYYQATELATNFNLMFNDTWLSATTAQGNPIRWTNSGTATFLWDVLPGRSDRLVIYRTTGAGLGNIEVCVVSCTTITNAATSAENVASGFITKANVGLNDISDTGNFLVTIRVATATPGMYIGLEGISVLANAAPLAPGYYEETAAATNFNLTYSATGWTPVLAGRGGNAMWTNSAATTTFAWFEMSFTTANQGEGLILYNAMGFPTAGVNLCVTTAGGAAPTNGCSASPTVNYTFGTSTRRWISEQDLGVTAVDGARRIIISPSSAAGSGQWFALEGLFVVGQSNNLGAPLTLVGGSPTGFYEPEAVGVRRVGAWAEYADPTALGGDTHWLASDRQAMLFNVDSATRGVAIYTTNYSGGGTIEVCIYSATNTATDDDACSTFNTNSVVTMQGINVVRIPPATTTTPSNATRLVEIRTTSAASVGIQGFRLLDNAAPLTPGMYQSSDVNVNASAGWVSSSSAVYDGSASLYSNTPNAALSFSVGGGTNGFVVYFTRAAWTSPFTICYDRVSDPSDDNLTPALGVGTCEQLTTVIAGATVENVYGMGFYGLPNRNLTNTADETYNVVITHTGTAAQYLFVDAINVLAVPTQSLVAGINDNTSAAIVYSPTNRWVQGATSTTVIAGGIAQTRFTGNSLIVYGSATGTGSTNVQFCVVVPNQLSPSARLQCGSFSQNGVSSYTPIILYGFGSGQHDVIFDNRAHGFTFTIDSLVPR
jgi:hypothetical protein